MAVSVPQTSDAATQTTGESAAAERRRYQPPTFEVICLACEISSYAPDGDDRPLF